LHYINPYANSEEISNNKHQKARILIIEDDTMISDLLKDFFDMNGYLCRTEPHATDIIRLINDYQPQLLLLDYLLPGTDGGELCRLVKSHPDSTQLPVLIYSAYTEKMLPLESFGCDAFLAKPFALDELQTLVKSLLSIDYPLRSAKHESSCSNS